jgi:hypothetical protein
MVDADCGVHLMIDSAEAQTNQYGTSVVTKFSILAATDPAQVGKTITQFLEVEGKAVDKIYNISEAIGQITHEQRAAAAQQGVGLEIDETQWKGRQLCGQIKMEMKQRKNLATGQYEDDPEHPNPYPQLGFRYFAVTSPRAADIPKDAAMLQAAGIVLPTGPAQAAKPAQKPATAPPAAVAQPAQGQLPLTGPTTPADMAW